MTSTGIEQGTPLAVVSPTSGQTIAQIPSSTIAGVAATCLRARQAQPAWGALPVPERARQLRRFARILRDDPDLLPILCSESGKPRHEAEAIELFYCCELIRYFTGRAGRGVLRDDLRHPFVFAHKRARVVHHPRGVVAVIGPWNWPLLNNFADAVAPLLAGNAVVLKPSPLTPLTSLHIQKLWTAAGLPPHVLQVCTGGGEVGEALVDRADMVFFTGSHTTGRAIARKAADRLIPVVLELGGKSAMIVCRDADLPRPHTRRSGAASLTAGRSASAPSGCWWTPS